MKRFNLDLKDRRILYELDKNARESASKIGKKIGLSSEVVNYRIKRLEEEKIITQYQLILNLSKLNLIHFKICLTFQHMNSKKLDEIIIKLKQIESIKWIASTSGNFDIILSIETDSIENINSLKDEILTHFEDYIDQKSISILVEAKRYSREYLLDESIMKEQLTIMKKDTKTEIDKVDDQILKKLSENARKPLVEIANELNTTARIIDYKIKRMEKEQLIVGFKIAINYGLLGIKFYKTFIYLDSPKKESIKQLNQYFNSDPNIIHSVQVLANWDFEPEFEVESEEKFNKKINDLKDNFSDIIKKIDVLTISKEHKFVYF